jgi:threonine dehydratase
MTEALPTFRDVIAAAHRIRPHIRKTPLEPAFGLSEKFFLKLENWQRTGSFKARGAINRLLLLSESERHAGVITASAGNHGLGVALAAELLGVPATIVVPENAAQAKIKALQRYAVTLIRYGQDYDDAEVYARNLSKERGAFFLHAFDDPQVIAGQGTVGWEVLEERPEITTLVVPIGGGGLISGVAVAAKSINPDVFIVGVQPEASPAMVRALDHGAVVETPFEPTIADGLAGRFVSDLTLRLTQAYVDQVVTVSEQSIHDAMRRLICDMHLMVEGSAAVGLAAVLEGAVSLQQGPIAVIVTGRNVSESVLQEVVR